MAGYKNRQIRQKEVPLGKSIAQGGNPEHYYNENPAWSFLSADANMWSFTEEHVGSLFWTEIFPYMKALESQTWSEVLVRDKKKNHSIQVDQLNKIARDRLTEKYIEAESIVSLRLTNVHRLYGYMTGSVFHVLWFDDKHGDNSACVCRSYLKHT